MPRRKKTGTKPGPNISTTKARGNKLIKTGRSLPPTKALGDMAEVLPKHFWQTYGFKKWRKRIILSLIALIIVVGGFLGYKFWDNISKIFSGNPFGLFSSQKLRGEDRGHVNILLAGNSADDPGHGGALLTDSIMIASINTKQNTAFLLSVPRDLWVNIPDNGYAKINEAYQDGYKLNKSSEEGMKLLSKVITQHFGLPIDYYALVNYQALKDSVNAVGGITIKIDSNDPRGIFDPNIDLATGKPLVKFTNGKHHINGQQALNLARSRGGSPYAYGLSGGDYDRTMHQRKMLVALKNKAISAGVISNPIKLSKLLDAAGKNIRTDFKTSEVHRAYELVKPISNNDIKSYGLNNINGEDKSLVAGQMINGQSVQVPKAGIGNFDQIKNFVNKLLTQIKKPEQSKH